MRSLRQRQTALPFLRRDAAERLQRLVNLSPHGSAFAARLKRKGKPHNVIVAAVANR